MEMEAQIRPQGELSAKLIHADGSVEDLGVLRDNRLWVRIVRWLSSHSWFTVLVWSVGAFLLSYYNVTSSLSFLVAGIVTTAGVNYMASDFASGGVTPTISGFKFHGSGTGTNAAAVGDTDLQTPAIPARVSGTASNPTANQYRSVATVPYTTTLAITEWGLFSAAGAGSPPSGGTLWDRRVFSAINVVNGDSIQFTYTLTVPSGGT